MRIKDIIQIIRTTMEMQTDYLQKKDSAPHIPGILSTKTENGYLRFYLRESTASKCGKYLPRSQMKLVKALAQQEYEASSTKETGKTVAHLQKCLAILDGCHDAEDVYDNLSEERKKLVIKRTPTTISVEQWKNVGPYKKLGFSKEDKYLFARNGHRVRSKSEEIIMNMLDDLEIPYLYEYPITIDDEVLYPDFRVLNVRTGKVYIYEHCGKIDDFDYVNRLFMKKIMLYAKKGIFLGDQLLITFETAMYPLNERFLMEFMKKFFL